MSTTLPHGIIQINEGNISWYGDITANWQLIDSKIGEYDAAVVSIPAPANNGTLTINYGGTTIAMFGADDAGNVSADIPAPGDGVLTVAQGGSTLGTFSANQAANSLIAIPEPGDGTLTIKVNGSTAGTFTANASTNATANIVVPTAVSELTNDSGYLTSSSNLDASKLTSGTVDIARLPQGALERLVKVANEAARYALTTADVQLGDTVQQLDTGIMYAVTDTDHLDSAAGYTEYTAGTATSVPWGGVTGKPTFAAVATSGSYNDLSNKPTIPTVNNGTLTIQKNGSTVKTFTANASSNVTCNITVPTKTSDLTNDSGFITSDNTKIPLAGSNQISGSLIPATDNSIDIGSSTKNIKMLYTKGITIDGTQFLPSDYATLSGLATVATSGSYNDLSNKPTIPTVNNATLTIQKNGTTVKTFTANASSNVTANITVPTKTSGLTNDSGFITSEIDSMGTGWVRFKSGLQICYGKATNTNALATGTTRFSFPKIFNITPSVVATPDISATYGCTAFVEGASTWVLNVYNAVNGVLQKTPDPVPCSYVAIGTWK